MIQPEAHSTLSGNAPIQNFGIELNATMFDMIVSKVYTNKVKAVIREWSTNAVDACIDAKRPIKFFVHLPTILEPWFSVRDYGTGLKPEDVLGLYSTLGASTKRDSNDFNGCFGIGRGAGLAYTSSFQVDSFYKGMKYSYVVSTDSGLPTMISLGETKTDEENGLQLKVNVDPKDINRFKETAEEVYKYFDVRPLTNVELTYKDDKLVASGSGWEIAATMDAGLVVMGGVAYTLELNYFDNATYSTFRYAGLTLKVPLGSVGITPGRESLSMDDRTIAFLQEQLNRVKTEFSASITRNLDSIDDIFTKLCKYNELVRGTTYTLRKLVSWKPNIPHTSIGQFVSYDITADSTFSIVQFQGHKHTKRNVQYFNGEFQTNLKFIVADTSRGLDDAARSYKATLQSDDHVILIRPKKLTKVGIQEFNDNLKTILAMFQNPPHVLTSSHTDTGMAASGSQKYVKRTSAKNFMVLQVTQTLRTYQRDMLSALSKDYDKFYYVECHSGAPVLQKDVSKEEYKTIIGMLSKGLTVEDRTAVIGVPQYALASVKSDERFVPLVDAFKEFAKTQTVDGDGIVKAYNTLRDFTYGYTEYNLQNLSFDKAVTKDITSTVTEYESFINSSPYGSMTIAQSFIDKYKIKTLKVKLSGDLLQFLEENPAFESTVRDAVAFKNVNELLTRAGIKYERKAKVIK